MTTDLTKNSPLILIDFGLSQFCDESNNEKKIGFTGTAEYIGFFECLLLILYIEIIKYFAYVDFVVTIKTNFEE
jgi:hypothetical protein